MTAKQTDSLKNIVADFCKHQDYGKAWKQLSLAGASLKVFSNYVKPPSKKHSKRYSSTVIQSLSCNKKYICN